MLCSTWGWQWKTSRLAAHALGLGTVHIGLFDHKKVETILGVPEGFCVVEMMPLGYPDGEVPDSFQKRLDRNCF